MEFVPVTADFTVGWVLLGAAFLFLVAVSFVHLRVGSRLFPLQMGLILVVILLYISAGVVLFSTMTQVAIRQETIAAEIQETYSVFPSDRQVRSLEYPAQKPSGGFEEFGSFQRDNGETAVLVWTDGEFQLGTMRGERFTEFERVDG